MPVTKGPLSAEQLAALAVDGLRHELVAGTLLSEPPAGGRHGRVLTPLASELHRFVRKNRLGVVYSGDVGFLLARSPDTVRAPDIAFLSRDRFLEAGDTSGYIPGPPDLAVEILSPTDRPGET